MFYVFDLLIFIIFIIFLVFFSIYLYNGTTIYELITLSQFDNIYQKIENDADKSNKQLLYYNTFLFAPSNTRIYRATANIDFNPSMNEILITNNIDQPKLNIYNDVAKLILLLSPAEGNFQFTPM